MKKILFLSGGWDGHRPGEFVQLMADNLKEAGLSAQVETTLDLLADAEALKQFAVIFPCWTMGALSDAQSKGLLAAVHGGAALAGLHGGMGDAFRGNLEYEWMTGGHFVGHPYVGGYTVDVIDRASPITEGLPASFAYDSEQYYMMVDPGIHVLADAEYVYEGKPCRMPIAWTKSWGRGRVFYSALGHAPEEYAKCKPALKLAVNGVKWAAGLLG